jgi:hypothetical protein
MAFRKTFRISVKNIPFEEGLELLEDISSCFEVQTIVVSRGGLSGH